MMIFLDRPLPNFFKAAGLLSLATATLCTASLELTVSSSTSSHERLDIRQGLETLGQQDHPIARCVRNIMGCCMCSTAAYFKALERDREHYQSIQQGCYCYCPCPGRCPTRYPFEHCLCYAPFACSPEQGCRPTYRAELKGDVKRCLQSGWKNGSCWTLGASLLVFANAGFILGGIYDSYSLVSLKVCNNPWLDGISTTGNTTYAHVTDGLIPLLPEAIQLRDRMEAFYNRTVNTRELGYNYYATWPGPKVKNGQEVQLPPSVTPPTPDCKQTFCIENDKIVVQIAKAFGENCFEATFDCGVKSTTITTVRSPSNFRDLMQISSLNPPPAQGNVSTVNTSSAEAQARQQYIESVIATFVSRAKVTTSTHAGYLGISLWISHYPMDDYAVCKKLQYTIFSLSQFSWITLGVGGSYLLEAIKVSLNIDLLNLRLTLPFIDLWALEVCKFNSRNYVEAIRYNTRICNILDQASFFAQRGMEEYTYYDAVEGTYAPAEYQNNQLVFDTYASLYPPLAPEAMHVEALLHNGSAFLCDINQYVVALNDRFQPDLTQFNLGFLYTLILPPIVTLWIISCCVLLEPFSDVNGYLLRSPEEAPANESSSDTGTLSVRNAPSEEQLSLRRKAKKALVRKARIMKWYYTLIPFCIYSLAILYAIYTQSTLLSGAVNPA